MKTLFRLFVFLVFLVNATCVTATVSSFAKAGPYAGDGSTGQEFSITFEFFNTSEVVATTRVTATGAEAVLAETTDYTITGTGSAPYTGGTVTLVGSLASTYTITLSRATTQTQATDLVTGDTLPAETLEDQYDKLEMQIQELQEEIDRCLRVPITDGSTVEAACALDDAVQRADCYLTFTSAGLPTATASALASTATTTTYTETLLDDANEAAFWTTLGFSAGVQSVLDDATLAAMKTTLGISSITVLDEDDMGAGSGSAVSPPSQDSVYEFLVTTAATMASKTLISPVLNTGLSGTAFLDEDAMTSDSATKAASQQSIKAYADSIVPATPKYAAYSYTIAQNSAGGAATASSWGTRPIDDEDVDADTIGAVSSNQITLDAGTYDFICHAVFFKTNLTRLRLRNTTAGTTLAVGVQAYLASGVNDGHVLSFSGRVTVAASQALEVQYYCSNTQATNGLGYPMNVASETERYLTIEFWEVP